MSSNREGFFVSGAILCSLLPAVTAVKVTLNVCSEIRSAESDSNVLIGFDGEAEFREPGSVNDYEVPLQATIPTFVNLTIDGENGLKICAVAVEGWQVLTNPFWLDQRCSQPSMYIDYTPCFASIALDLFPNVLVVAGMDHVYHGSWLNGIYGIYGISSGKPLYTAFVNTGALRLLMWNGNAWVFKDRGRDAILAYRLDAVGKSPVRATVEPWKYTENGNIKNDTDVTIIGHLNIFLPRQNQITHIIALCCPSLLLTNNLTSTNRFLR